MVVEVGKILPPTTGGGLSLVSSSIPILVFGSIALYNVLELNYMILGTFRRRNTLYFWSLIIATWGIALNAVGYLLEHLQLVSNAYICSVLICVGWVCMVTGQSVVLYSRLHLVMTDDRRRRAVLYMIIFDAITMHVPVIVLVFGSNSNKSDMFLRPYMIYEKLQLSVFFIQECIISGLYVWETIKLLRYTKDIRGKRGARRVMSHLILVNIVVIVLDISVLALEYSNYYELQTGYKPLVYSIKLKMELVILNRLVELTRQSSQGSLSFSTNDGATPSIALETFNQNPLRRLRNDTGGEGMGYKASIGTSGQPGLKIKIDGPRIVRETEVTSEPRPRQQGESLEHIIGESSHRSSLECENDIADAASTSSVSPFAVMAR